MQKYIRFCPQCKSTKVTNRGMLSKNAYSNVYVCLTCGFQSPLFPEIEESGREHLNDGRQNFITTRLPAFSDYSNMWRGAKIYLGIMAAVLLLFAAVLTIQYIKAGESTALIIALILYFIGFYVISGIQRARRMEKKVDEEYEKASKKSD